MGPTSGDTKDLGGPPLKVDSENVENTSVGQVSRRQRTGRHCRRWWWVWLIAFLVFVLVIVIIVIYGIIPPVAQKKLDNTWLSLNSLSILAPTVSSFAVSLNADIKGASGIALDARLDPFDVDFFLDGTDRDTQTFLTLHLDGFKASRSVPIVQTNVPVNISNESALEGFAKKLLGEETLKVALRGRTTVHLGSIHTGVNYREVFTLKGLNNLAGMAITSYTLSSSKTSNIEGQVLIPNPSLVTVEMGDVNLGIAVQGIELGTGLIPNLTLTPGNNSYTFNALIAAAHLPALIGAIGKNESLTITSNGTEVSGNAIPWLSAPLQGLNTTVPFKSS